MSHLIVNDSTCQLPVIEFAEYDSSNDEAETAGLNAILDSTLDGFGFNDEQKEESKQETDILTYVLNDNTQSDDAIFNSAFAEFELQNEDELKQDGKEWMSMSPLKITISVKNSKYLLNTCDIFKNTECDQQSSHINSQKLWTDDLMNQLNETGINNKDRLSSKFETFIIDEEYDSDAICQDLTDPSSSNIIQIWLVRPLISKLSSFYEIYELCATNTELLKCDSLRRINKILSAYHQFLNQQKQNKANCDIFKSVFDKIGSDYDMVKLQNDNNHLMHFHCQQFEDIHKMLVLSLDSKTSSCDLSQCLLMRRNHRNRQQDNIKHLYFTKNTQQVIAQQLLDRIHCYYLHTFDIGYRISSKERETIISDARNDRDVTRPMTMMTMDDILNDRIVFGISKLMSSKRERYCNIDGLERLKQNNKYVTDLAEERKEDREAGKLNEYSFGFRFYYHEKYANNQEIEDPASRFYHIHSTATKGGSVIDMDKTYGLQSVQGYRLSELYIAHKYANIKQELQENTIYSISATKWGNLYEKALIYIATERAKQIECPRMKSAECYDMNHGDTIKTEHILAMMCYCNLDSLQRKFTETYRKLNEDDDLDIMKERHRNYCWLGRYLRECVECFGMKHNGEKTIQLYHGANQQFIFSTLCAYVNGPLSTSTSYPVACHFGAGMILELNIKTEEWIMQYVEVEAMQSLTCFDASYLSDYPNEQEIFCLGGMSNFHFHTIIDPSRGINYEKYIKGLTQMTQGMRMHSSGMTLQLMGNWTVPQSKEEKQIVYRLLIHQIWKSLPNHPYAYRFKSLPEYMDELMDRHCKSITNIMIGLEKHIVLDKILRTDDGWIDLDLLLTVFPNVQYIGFKGGWDKSIEYWKRTSLYESVLDFIDKRKNEKITHFEISIDLNCRQKLQQFITKTYKNEFDDRGWQFRFEVYDVAEMFLGSLGLGGEKGGKYWLNMINANPIFKSMFVERIDDCEHLLTFLLRQSNISLNEFKEKVWTNEFDIEKLNHCMLHIHRK